MKTKTIWFLLSAAMILALATTIIALGLSNSNLIGEGRTQMDNKDRSAHNPQSDQDRAAQPNSGQSAANSAAEEPAPKETRAVIINRTSLSEEQLRTLEQQYHYRIPDGSYWYDKNTGAWGMEGGPTRGFTLPGFDVGGPLRADASQGNTHVFINGRELHYLDVLGLQRITGQVIPGRYWVNAQGYCGYEGGPALINLVELAQAANQKAGSGGGGYNPEIGSVIGDGSGFIGFTSKDSSATLSR